MKYLPDNFLLEMSNALNYQETQTETIRPQSRPPGEVLLGSGPLVPLDHALLEQRALPGHEVNLADTPLRAPWIPLIRSELGLLGRLAHLTLKVIRLLGLEDLGCIPNVASNAFQPIQVIFIHILQERRKSERYRYSVSLQWNVLMIFYQLVAVLGA